MRDICNKICQIQVDDWDLRAEGFYHGNICRIIEHTSLENKEELCVYVALIDKPDFTVWVAPIEIKVFDGYSK